MYNNTIKYYTETQGSGDHGESIPSSPAQPRGKAGNKWTVDMVVPASLPIPLTNYNQCQGRKMEMNVSKGSGGRLSWVRGCGPVCVAAAGWRDLLATVETMARCGAVGGHRAVVTLPPLLPHHLHTATCSHNLGLGVRHAQCQQ